MYDYDSMAFRALLITWTQVLLVHKTFPGGPDFPGGHGDTFVVLTETFLSKSWIDEVFHKIQITVSCCNRPPFVRRKISAFPSD